MRCGACANEVLVEGSAKCGRCGASLLDPGDLSADLAARKPAHEVTTVRFVDPAVVAALRPPKAGSVSTSPAFNTADAAQGVRSLPPAPVPVASPSAHGVTGLDDGSGGSQPWQAPRTAQLATWSERVAATLIEVGLFLGAVVVVGIPANAISSTLAGVAGALVLLLFVYWQFQNGSCGQSPGKALLGLRVVGQRTGEPIGGAMGLLRYLVAAALSVFTCGIGQLVDYLFPLWDANRQTLHDKVVGSVVLAGQPRRKFLEILKP
jgi:uncharacterized RDD family membrane protein YckC